MAQSTAFVNIPGRVRALRASVGRVVVRPDMLESKRLIIPTAARERQMATTGVIADIGEPESSLFTFAVGDRVVFSRYAGIGVTVKEGEKETVYLVMTHSDIACKIEEEPEEVRTPHA